MKRRTHKVKFTDPYEINRFHSYIVRSELPNRNEKELQFFIQEIWKDIICKLKKAFSKTVFTHPKKITIEFDRKELKILSCIFKMNRTNEVDILLLQEQIINSQLLLN